MIVIFGCTARIRELTVNGMSEMGNLVKRKGLDASSPASKGTVTEFARDPTYAIVRTQRGLGSRKHRKELSKLSGLPLPSERIYHLAASPWGYQSMTVIKKDWVIVSLRLGSSRMGDIGLHKWGFKQELKRLTTSLGVRDTDLLSVVLCLKNSSKSLQARSQRVIQGT